MTDDKVNSLAYAEMRLITAKMLWNFDFELADPTDDWMSHNRGYSVWYKMPLKVKLTPRRTEP
jgi:cytochrome P450